MNSIIEVAIKLLSDRNCSEQELKHQLEKECSALPHADARIESALVRLRELHLVNDRRLAESLALRFEQKGNRFIIQALKQKGIPDEVIKDALASLGDEYERALNEARRKIIQKQGEPPERARNHIYRFLNGRGFSFDNINRVVGQLTEEGFFSPEIH